MEQITSGEIERRLLDRTSEQDGEVRITCEQALALANELEVPPARIGDLCDQHGIKVRGCQLNCF